MFTICPLTFAESRFFAPFAEGEYHGPHAVPPLAIAFSAGGHGRPRHVLAIRLSRVYNKSLLFRDLAEQPPRVE